MLDALFHCSAVSSLFAVAATEHLYKVEAGL